MAKKEKLKTPDWILKGGEPTKSKKKEKTFKIKKCPECRGYDVSIVIAEGEEKTTGEWKCHKCNWRGKNIEEEELGEEEFMKYLDENNVPVS